MTRLPFKRRLIITPTTIVPAPTAPAPTTPAPKPRDLLNGMECSYQYCHEPATTLLVETARRQGRTFGHGAGITCERHARESEIDGCRRIETKSKQRGGR